MWPFNYNFSVWGTVVLYVLLTAGYIVWMLAMNAKEKRNGSKGGA